MAEYRAKCMNAACNRTYKTHPGGEVVCNKCMKLCPTEHKRYRYLRRRYNHSRRYPQKWSKQKLDQLYDLMDKNWRQLKRKLSSTEGPPADFASFKREMGWND